MWAAHPPIILLNFNNSMKTESKLKQTRLLRVPVSHCVLVIFLGLCEFVKMVAIQLVFGAGYSPKITQTVLFQSGSCSFQLFKKKKRKKNVVYALLIFLRLQSHMTKIKESNETRRGNNALNTPDYFSNFANRLHKSTRIQMLQTQDAVCTTAQFI